MRRVIRLKPFRYAAYLYLTLKFGLLLMLPMSALAATQPLDVSGWMPYWRDSEAIKDAKKHLSDLDAVYPFAFSVKEDGTLKDLAGLGESDWKAFIKSAKRKKVEIIPTIMWSDGQNIDRILCN